MEIEPQRGVQRSEGHFISAQGAFQRVLLELRNQFTFTNHNSGLWATEQFVAGEAHQAHACGDHLLRHRLFRQTVETQIHQRTAAQIGNDRHVQFAANLRQLRLFHRFGKAFNVIVAGVDFHQQRGVFVNRRAIIFRMRAVGGPDFMQLAARLTHHVRNAERAANLHQLAARHHYLFAAGGGRQHQQNRRRVIVHNAGIFRARYLAQKISQRAVAVSTPGTVQIVLQRHRGSHRLRDRRYRLFRLWRAA
ncbi:hypothetical protein D3C72_1195340 [compost metagenome]